MSIEWNGEGFPPLGCECEIAEPIYNAGTRVRVLAIDEGAAICRILEGDRLHSLCQLECSEIRPAMTEEERQRQTRINMMNGFIDGFMKSSNGNYANLAAALHDYLSLNDRLN